MDGFAWTVVGSVAGVVGAVAAVIAIVRARADPGGGAGPDRASDVRARGRGLAVGTNTGTVIRARTVHIGTAPPGGAAGQAALPTLGGGDTLPARTPVFTGRAAALADLADRLAGGPVAVVAVRGLGGVGKSQLALEYAHRERASGRCRVAGWVRADSPVTVAEDLAALGSLLGLASDGTMGERAAGVVAALGAREDWLLVFDNAHRPGDLQGWLPGGAGHVLITSRERARIRLPALADRALGSVLLRRLLACVPRDRLPASTAQLRRQAKPTPSLTPPAADSWASWTVPAQPSSAP